MAEWKGLKDNLLHLKHTDIVADLMQLSSFRSCVYIKILWPCDAGMGDWHSHHPGSPDARRSVLHDDRTNSLSFFA
jgi:hypothetical protein